MAKKTCYYELLGVDRKCEASDVKSAYRKLALKMHPDKASMNNLTVEDATKKFQQIQEAYSTLSDPQERAWYDAHREQILKGDDEPGEDPFKTKINLYKYFSAGCYDGFHDGAGGFFAVYADLFKSIDQEEEEWEDADEEHVAMPPFGKSDSEWSEVSTFYRHWLDFCSRKAFGHADKWNPREAPNRQTRRAMEQENKKARQEAKKAFNAEVRQIVQRIQRRDPRVAAHQKQQLKESAEKSQREAAEKEQRKAEEARERQQRKDAARKAEEERWAEMEATRAARKERGEAVSDDEENQSDDEVMYSCEACRKSFKSEAAFEQHAKSKKHLQLVQKLRKELERDLQLERKKAARQVEEEATDGESSHASSSSSVRAVKVDSSSPVEAAKGNSTSQARENGSSSEGENGEETDDDDEEDAFVARFAAAKQQKGQGRVKNFAPPARSPGGAASSAASEARDLNAGGVPPTEEASSDGAAEAPANLSLEELKAEKLSSLRKRAKEAGSTEDQLEEADDEGDKERQKELYIQLILKAAPDLGSSGSKKAQKRAKQKAILLEKKKDKEHVQELVDSLRKSRDTDAGVTDGHDRGEVDKAADHCQPCSVPTPGRSGGKSSKGNASADGPAESRCAVCGEEFPSRTKLHQHLKTSGHAAPKEVAPEPTKGGKKKKR